MNFFFYKTYLAIFLIVISSVSAIAQKEDKHIKKGKKLMFHEKYNEAQVEFSNALKINPKNINVLIYKSLIHEELNEHQEAINTITEVFQLGYTPPSLYLRRANNFHDIQQDGKALKDINTFLKTDSTSLDGLYLRGIVYLALDKFTLATIDFTNMLNNTLKRNISTKGLNYIYLTRSLSYSESEKYDKALNDVNIVIKTDSNNYKAYEYRSEINLKIDQLQEALKDINHSLEIKPNNIDALITKSEILLELKDYKNMCLCFNKAIEYGFKPVTDKLQKITTHCN